jgi:hypothetical protein
LTDVCAARAPQVVPLYGRGGNGKDPRKMAVDGLPIPSRPAAQRPPVQVRRQAQNLPHTRC